MKIDGGMLVQNADDEFSEDISVVTEKQPTDEQRKALISHKEL